MKNQERENRQIAIAISQSLQDQEFMIIKFISLKGEGQLVGLITKLDHSFRCVKISHGDGIERVPLDDIISIEPTIFLNKAA